MGFNNLIEKRKKLWQLLKNPRKITRPAFVVGSGRSGTSMLIFHLAKSWEIDLYNENHPEAFRNWRLRRLSRIEELVNRSSARVTLFKPILNTPQTPALLERFPDAKIIFCFRNYNDVINSSIKKFGLMNRLEHVTSWIKDDFLEFSNYCPPERTMQAIRSHWSEELSPEDGAALYWLFYNRLFFDLELDHDQRVLLVQYESLVTRPKEEFQRVCNFLEMSFNPKMGDEIYSSSVGRDPFPVLHPEIKEACDQLWHQLCSALDNYRSPENS